MHGVCVKIGGPGKKIKNQLSLVPLFQGDQGTLHDPVPRHYLKPWSFPGPPEKALADLEQVLKAYPPGQQDIDGGGFQIQKLEPKAHGWQTVYNVWVCLFFSDSSCESC